MPPIQYYWVIARPTDTESQAVGPHTLYKIRFWVAEEILPPDILLRREGESTWVKARDIPGFYDFPERLRESLARSNHDRREIIKAKGPDPEGPWWQKPAGNSQIEQLKFMRIPFDPKKLTRYWADKLIYGFAEIDSDCYQEYIDRPPTPEIIEGLRGLGKTDTEGLSIGEARSILWDLQEKREVEQNALSNLEGSVNYAGSHILEEMGIRPLNKTELRKFKAYLDQNVRNWEDKDYQLLCKLIPKALPHPVGLGTDGTRRTGCIVLIVILLIIIVKLILG